MGGLVKSLVVVDTEYAKPNWSGADPRHLRAEKARRYARCHQKRRQPVEVGNRGADGIAGNLRALPFNRIGDRSIAQHTEVEGLVGVFPNIFRVDHQVLAEGLLKSRME